MTDGVASILELSSESIDVADRGDAALGVLASWVVDFDGGAFLVFDVGELAGFEEVGVFGGSDWYLVVFVGPVVSDEEVVGGERRRRGVDQNVVYLPYSLHLLSCLLYTSPSPRDLSTSRMPSSA